MGPLSNGAEMDVRCRWLGRLSMHPRRLYRPPRQSFVSSNVLHHNMLCRPNKIDFWLWG